MKGKSGKRLLDYCSIIVWIRVQEIDFDMQQIIVQDCKRKKDRVTMLPDIV